MAPYGEDDWYFSTLSLPPGEYGYLIDDDHGIHPDQYNPQRTYRGEAEVSRALVQDCEKPLVIVESVIANESGEVDIAGTFYRAAAKNGSAGEGDSGVAALLRSAQATLQNAPLGQSRTLTANEISPEKGTFLLQGKDFSPGRYTFRIEAKDAEGAVAEAPLAIAWVKPRAPSFEQGLIYQVVIDRFRGDGGEALSPPETPGRRAGGTLGGVLSGLESGYFESLGTSTLWLSPVYENPTGLFVGRDGELYEGYHGYWPKNSQRVDPLIGGDEALRAVISEAHKRGIFVLLDFVPNHLHDENPRYQTFAEQGFFNNGPGTCVCGAPDCAWNDHILECWFAPYLPDVRFQSQGSMNMALADLSFWMKQFDADGVRIDAVPMMPRPATRRMALSLRSEYAPSNALFSIGEVFTGPGPSGFDAIKYFLGPDGIDGAFDFPLTWAIRNVIATETGGFYDIEEALLYSETALSGSGSVLGRMVGNHDMSRFISDATGHGGANAWKTPAPDPSSALPYEKLKVALGLVMTLPGIPVIYQGDEVGLAGGSDPDNRRVLPADEALSVFQKDVRDQTQKLGKVRACSSALRKGSREAFLAAKRTYGFARVAEDEAALVLVSTESAETQIAPPLALVPAGVYVDALTLTPFAIGNGEAIACSPYSVRVLLPENSPCLLLLQ